MSVGLSLVPATPLAPLADLSPLSDEQLLSRFFRGREDAAFEEIVKRHGPVVYGVCRRILSHANDAEDAFQATFMVLVRKGASLRQPGKLSSWLYGVANRTARKFRLKAALRSRSEQAVGERPLPAAVRDMTYDELRTILDEEIAQLPEKYALPLVLCYLEGKTNAQAAAQLGWPEGSMSRRLARGRELLRSRLTRRGLALSAALIVAVFAKPAPASVPAALSAATAKAGQLVAGGAKLHDVVSPRAAKAVVDVLAALSAAARTTNAAVLAAASILIALTTAVWQFGSPAYAATLFDFHQVNWFHGLTGTDHHPGIVITATGAPVATGGCGAPLTTSSGATASTVTVTSSTVTVTTAGAPAAGADVAASAATKLATPPQP